MPRIPPCRTLLIVVPLLLSAAPILAQPAPDARPVGGTVVAGSAAIARSATVTSITQSTQRAAIDWQGFDVGAKQSVTFAQPSATAMTLNRVTGPDPSRIAGRITANGQIVLVNKSGVVFYRGAQVNTNGLMVTAAGISNRNFMAGRMVFDEPAKPNARIENHGEITIRKAGLAALVAPQVANSGVITARLGHVVLAGAQTAALDLYGDGLLAIDVTRQVRQAPIGPDGKPVTVLVTNTGLIRADGGTVQLTARAADGIVQDLVDAGGRIQADTLGTRKGTVVLAGVGGSIRISGQVSAQGRAAGDAGGQIVADASGDVVVQSGATIDASGQAGGGTIALGTTLDRAKAGPGTASSLTAQRTLIAPDATIAADAIERGDGGHVVVLSDAATAMAGTVSAQGGAHGGGGGFVEISSNDALSFTGSANVRAPAGRLGTILFDPRDLVISDVQPEGYTAITPNPSAPNVTAGGFPDANTDSWISPTVLEGLTGNVEVQTTRDLMVESPLLIGFDANTGQSLTLQAGRNLTVYSLETASLPMVGASGNVVLQAGTNDPTGTLNLYGAVVSQLGSVFLSAPADIFFGNQVIANATGRDQGITGKLISIRSDYVEFAAPGDFVGGSLDVAGGTIEVAPFTSGLPIVVGGDSSGELDLLPLPVVTATGFATPDLRLGATTDPVTGSMTTTAGNIAIDGALYDTGLNGANLEFDAQGSVSQTVALQSVGTVSGHAANLGLTDPGNAIAALGAFTAGDALAMNDATPLTIDGPLGAATVLIDSTGSMTLAGNISTPSIELAVLADEVGAAQFTQTGNVSAGSGSTPTFRLVLPTSGGSASFAGLAAPQAQVTLLLGSGTAAGTLQIGGLLVEGQNGSATLEGSIAGVTTQAAASLGQITPAVDPSYTFNGCTIGLAACAAPPTPTPTQVTLLPPMTGGLSQFLPGTLSPAAPAFSAIDLTLIGGVPPAFGELAGPDVVLPNISFRDY